MGRLRYITVTSNSESLSFKIAPYSEAYRFVKIITDIRKQSWKKINYCFYQNVFFCISLLLYIPEDSMWYHDGMFFSTYDKDNDYSVYNCGSKWRGGWWYRACHRANLNGDYGNTKYGKGINWNSWKGFYYSMNEVRMMVRNPLSWELCRIH